MIETLKHFVRAGLFFWLVAFGLGTTQAAVPQQLNHQGRVAVNGVNFDGNGQFKFALVNANGSTTYWSNDGSSNADSQPSSHVTLAVTKGLYSVLLGDTTLTNMTALPSSALDHGDVRLRIWFSDGSSRVSNSSRPISAWLQRPMRCLRPKRHRPPVLTARLQAM